MDSFSIIGLPADFMESFTAFLLFTVFVGAVFIMHRMHRKDDRIIYPGTVQAQVKPEVKLRKPVKPKN